MPKGSLAIEDNIASSILLTCGHKVMQDVDLAALYGVETNTLKGVAMLSSVLRSN